ncbi:hypothetical protein EVAR_14878_1 [Eumeta japonica]|uniref:Uncharacterized protein n=1 Tax=Eumeta variegata TaxID=151549 RepID=A0A4C1V4J3_EUMVA|nr:hypothetical protein EVAR_14878_1 [Eumeta japonica]
MDFDNDDVIDPEFESLFKENSMSNNDADTTAIDLDSIIDLIKNTETVPQAVKSDQQATPSVKNNNKKNKCRIICFSRIISSELNERQNWDPDHNQNKGRIGIAIEGGIKVGNVYDSVTVSDSLSTPVPAVGDAIEGVSQSKKQFPARHADAACVVTCHTQRQFDFINILEGDETYSGNVNH